MVKYQAWIDAKETKTAARVEQTAAEKEAFRLAVSGVAKAKPVAVVEEPVVEEEATDAPAEETPSEETSEETAE
jgi:small subunit ribosomal protein S16